MTHDPLTAAAYLSALIDGEGHVTKPENGRAIAIGNTDRAIIEACEACCDTLELAWTERLSHGRTERCKPVWTVRISGRETLIRANEVLQLQAPAKAARLREHVESYQYKPPCSKSELEELYGTQQLSVRELARRFGRSERSVWHWIGKYGIRRRSRSEASLIAWANR